jgi:hypothetical protein
MDMFAGADGVDAKTSDVTTRSQGSFTGSESSLASSVQAGRIGLFALVAGLAAGLAAWGLGEQLHEFFAPTLAQGDFDSKLYVPSPETKSWANVRNSTLAFGLLGGSLGLALGVAGGLAARSPRSAVKAGLVGLVLTSAVAVLISAVVLRFCHERRFSLPQDELYFAVPLHMLLWGPLGAGAGLAFGMGLGTKSQALQGAIGGFLGALVGATVFDFAGAALFPMAETVRARSLTWDSRLLARLSVACLSSLGAARFCHAEIGRRTAASTGAVGPVLGEPSGADPLSVRA